MPEAASATRQEYPRHDRPGPDLLPNLKLLEARPSADHFAVLTATNGADAVQLRAGRNRGIVFLDVIMPEWIGGRRAPLIGKFELAGAGG